MTFYYSRFGEIRVHEAFAKCASCAYDFADVFYRETFNKGESCVWKVHEGVVDHSRLTTGPLGPVYGRAIATSSYRQRRPTGSTTGDYSISASLVLVIFWLCATRPVPSSFQLKTELTCANFKSLPYYSPRELLKKFAKTAKTKRRDVSGKFYQYFDISR